MGLDHLFTLSLEERWSESSNREANPSFAFRTRAFWGERECDRPLTTLAIITRNSEFQFDGSNRRFSHERPSLSRRGTTYESVRRPVRARRPS